MGATGIMAASLGIQGIAGMYGAHSQAQAQNANLNAAQANHNQLLQMIQGQMSGGQNPYAGMYMNALQSLGSGTAGSGLHPLGQPSGTPTDLVNQFTMHPQVAQENPNFAGSNGMLSPPQFSPEGTGGGEVSPFFGVPANDMTFGSPSTGSALNFGSPTQPQEYAPPSLGDQFFTNQAAQKQSQQSQQPVSGFTPYNPLSAQVQHPFTYNPAQLGQAPQVGAFGQVNADTLRQQQTQGVQQVNAPAQAQYDNISSAMLQPQQAGSFQQVQAPGQMQFDQVRAANATGAQVQLPGMVSQPGSFNAPQINAPAAVGTQGMNSGQDALMQMMRANLGPPSDASLQQNMQKQIGGFGGGGAFDPSALLNSMKTNQQQTLNEQVAGLQGSAGSLGQRFGTGMANAEARLRTNLGSQFEQQNQQVAQSAFENAANRSSQALGLQQGYQQTLNQLPFQQAQLQQQAAASGGALQQQGSQLDLQAQIQNAMNSLQAQQSNQGAALQTGLQGQNLGLQAQLANQATQGQIGTVNAGFQQQAGLANQQAGLSAQQMNQQGQLQAGSLSAQQQLQAMLANQQAGLQNNQFYSQLGQQAGIANQASGLAAQQSNQQAQLQTGQQYSAQQLQAMLANQQTGMQNNQFYSQLGQQVGIANQNAGLTAQQSNQQAQLQALLANQNWAGQYGMANQNSANQAGQFNAQAGMAQAAFNAQQGNQFNTLQQSLVGQAQGAQQWQQQYNAGLMSLLAGLPMPQQQASPYPGAVAGLGNDAMTMALLRQFMSHQPSTTTVVQGA